MSPLLFTLLQAAFLVLLYAFVARAVRWVVRDVRNASPGGPAPVEAAVVAPAVGPPVAADRGAAAHRRRAGRRRAGHRAPEAPPRVLSLDGAGSITFGRRDDATVVIAAYLERRPRAGLPGRRGVDADGRGVDQRHLSELRAARGADAPAPR